MDRREALLRMAAAGWGSALPLQAGARQATPGPGAALRCFPTGAIYDYRWQLLKLALGAGNSRWRNAEIRGQGDPDLTQGRAERQLLAGELDVLCFSTSAERQQMLRQVPVELLKGLIGLRYLIVRREDQQRIAAMSDDDYLHRLRFGLHAQWADVTLMQGNGLTVVPASVASLLYAMLAAGRCDALPRGANEVELDLAAHQRAATPLVVESSRALYIPLPVYFWVHPDRQDLALAIEAGLRQVQASGAWQRLFLTAHAKALRFVAHNRRRVLTLKGAGLPQPMEMPDTSWWGPAVSFRPG